MSFLLFDLVYGPRKALTHGTVHRLTIKPSPRSDSILRIMSDGKLYTADALAEELGTSPHNVRQRLRGLAKLQKVFRAAYVQRGRGKVTLWKIKEGA